MGKKRATTTGATVPFSFLKQSLVALDVGAANEKEAEVKNMDAITASLQVSPAFRLNTMHRIDFLLEALSKS